MSLTVKAGSTDQTVYVFIQDSSVTTGAGLTGLAYNSASLVAYYVTNRGAATQITLATLASATAAHSDGGFIEVDATNMPGVYRLDLPDAAVASGNQVIVELKGATNMAPVAKEIFLVAFDPQSATNLGLSKFADIETDTQAIQTDIDAMQIVVDDIQLDTGTNIPNALSVVYTDTQATVTALGTAGAGLTSIPWNAAWDAEVQSECADAIAAYDPPTNAEMVARTLATADYATATALAAVDTVVDAILVDTAVIGAAGAGLTALPWNAAWDAEVQSEVTDALNAYDPPTNAEMVARTILSAEYATATDLATVDTVVDAVKVKTDQLAFGVASTVNANITYVNEVAVNGDGAGTPWGP